MQIREVDKIKMISYCYKRLLVVFILDISRGFGDSQSLNAIL
jgi:hypothetical protein